MAITKLNSQAIPPNTIVESDLSYPLTNFSSTGIDDNATSTAITIDANENVGVGDTGPDVKLKIRGGTGTIEPQVTIEATAFNAGQGTALNFSRAGFTQPIQARISAIDNGAAGSNFIFSTKVDGTAGALTERIRILTSGGITFNGDTAAANALDDYEEGTWTPAFVNGTFTYVGQYGRYTKIGDTIVANGAVQYSAKSGTGQALISLPFTAQTNRFGVSLGYLAGLDNNEIQITAGGNGGTNTIVFWKIRNQSSPVQSLVQNMASSGEIQFSCVYQVAT